MSEDRARAVLALDGGGVRGTITIAFLRRMEELIGGRDAADDAVLSDYFDLVGGTSTGAIIATALSLGMSAKYIESLYFQLAPQVFRRPRFRLVGFQSVFDARNLEEEIVRICGERTLETPDLKTFLGIIMKRVDTGSPWIVTNNPRSKYWEDGNDGRRLGNRRYRLSDVVRASTAAPHYFSPESISIVDGEPAGLFVDGGVTPHNNPALAMLHVATLPQYGLGWPTGQSRLLIVSVGTGSFRPRLDPQKARRMMAAGLAIKALQGMIADGENHVLTELQLLGHTDTPWTINAELGDLQGTLLVPEPLFTVQRYDVRLERDWLKQHLGIDVSAKQIEIVRKMEDPRGVPLASEIGHAAAEAFVKTEHFDLLRRKA